MSERTFAIDDRSLVAVTHRDFQRQVGRMAERLRNTADRVERLGRDVEHQDRPRHYAALEEVSAGEVSQAQG